MDSEEIDNRFSYNPPRSTARVKDHEFARGRCKDLAYQLSRLLPEGREKSLVITKLEEAMFWANAALARAPDPDAIVSDEEAAAGPYRLGEGEPFLDRDDEERAPRGQMESLGGPAVAPPLRCTAPVADHEQCAEPAFGHIVMAGGKKRPMCEYHWHENDSGHPKEELER